MNNVVEMLLNHRSIRAFKDEAIDQNILKELLEVANRTSSSMGMQSFSIIRVTDKEKRAKIAEICKQNYVNEASEFLLFIADNYRNSSIAIEQGRYFDNRADADKFFQGFTDACLAAQNVLVAAESYGLGGVFFGSIMNDLDQMIELLNLPEYTLPVLGLGIGYPDQEPLLKPRMDVELKVFENEYVKQDNYLKALKDYDQEIKKYYDLRSPEKPVDEFTKQIVNIFENNKMNYSNIINVIRKQGYELGLEYLHDSEIRNQFKKSFVEVKEEEVFEQGKYGLKLDTKISDVFDERPYIKNYLLSINPKFNKINDLSIITKMRNMTIEEIAEIGEMPADSLIYMIESRIDEE